jgi:EAL domain-containing protein (putative c-di-GMP-specific phosphodiesterase class I)/AmiR/NasT family two-component response regulator
MSVPLGRVSMARVIGDEVSEPIGVLIADDDEMNRETLTEIIERSEMLKLVGIAKDADEAIRIASLRRPDVVLLDVRMPGGGGSRAAREICSRSPGSRVIALSAFDDDRSVDSMLASGATSYITKDASFDEIVDAIVRSVRGDALLSNTVTNHVVAELGARLEHDRELAQDRGAKERRIRRLLTKADEMTMVFQPIVSLETGVIEGVEALARFTQPPHRTPDLWFAEAIEVGLGTELQLMAVSCALPALYQLPEDVWIAVNVDPTTASSPLLAQIIRGFPAERIVLELTEHAPASDYPSLREALDVLRRSRVRISVDDAGAGFASLKHILELSPDIIKLDISIVREIDRLASHRALAAALMGFSREMGTELIAEGVETAGEASALDLLGIRLVQGYYLARPGPLADLALRRPSFVPRSQVASEPRSLTKLPHTA